MHIARVGLALLPLVAPLSGCASSNAARPWSPESAGVSRSSLVPVEGGRVWYEVAGNGPGTPLLVVHGGPGLPHDYLANLAELGVDRPVIFYDQLGCGRSDRPENTSFWTRERFVRELAEVRRALHLDRCFILGHSWGTVLAADYLLTKPAGVKGVVFANEALSIPRTVAYMQTLIDALPPDTRDTIRRCEREGRTDAPEYKAAADVFYKRHLCRLDPWPDDLTRSYAGLGESVYSYMNGPSEFAITGTIKDVDVTARLSEISVPALFVAGEFDEVPPRGAVEDAARMRDASVVLIQGAAHMTHLDRPCEFMSTVAAWLREHDDHRSR